MYRPSYPIYNSPIAIPVKTASTCPLSLWDELGSGKKKRQAIEMALALGREKHRVNICLNNGVSIQVICTKSTRVSVRIKPILSFVEYQSTLCLAFVVEKARMPVF